MNKGTAKWPSSQKGYGLIINEENGMDISAHLSGIASDGFKSPEEGQAVTSDITDSLRGFQVVNVCAA